MKTPMILELGASRTVTIDAHTRPDSVVTSAALTITTER